jgi:hypothetical protein
LKIGKAGKIGLLVVLLAFCIINAYWFIRALSFEGFFHYFGTAGEWTIKTYINATSEFLGSIGPILRMAASVLAIAAFTAALMGKPALRLLGFALLFEAVNSMFFFVSGVRAFVFSGSLAFNLLEMGIPMFVAGIGIPVCLLKLRSKLFNPESRGQAIKWSYIAGLIYLVVFWLNYAGQWFALLIQPDIYASSYPGFGLGFILNYPINMFNFLLTSVGLLLLAVYFAWDTSRVIRDPTKFNLRKVGIVVTLLGAYFIVTLLVFFMFGTVGGKSLPYVYMLYHNVDHWAIILPILGIPLILERARDSPARATEIK